MAKIIRTLETLLTEVHKTKGWKYVEEPLWVTWSLEKFGTSSPAPPPPLMLVLEPVPA